MSFEDSEYLGSHKIDYDSDLSENRATRYGEVQDTLYPLSNFRGGWSNLGSGPKVSYSSQLAGGLNIPDINNPEIGLRNIVLDRNRRKELLESTPTSAMVEAKQETVFRTPGLIVHLSTIFYLLLLILLVVIIGQNFMLNRNITLLLSTAVRH